MKSLAKINSFTFCQILVLAGVYGMSNFVSYLTANTFLCK